MEFGRHPLPKKVTVDKGEKARNGFQKVKSTEHAILGLYKNLVEGIEKKEKTCAVFLDFAKALDTVNHKIL